MIHFFRFPGQRAHAFPSCLHSRCLLVHDQFVFRIRSLIVQYEVTEEKEFIRGSRGQRDFALLSPLSD